MVFPGGKPQALLNFEKVRKGDINEKKKRERENKRPKI